MNDYSDVIKLLNKNIDCYNTSEIEYIIHNYKNFENNYFIPWYLLQLYDELGYIDKKNNPYIGFVDLIDENYNINSNIVEVGCGVLPRTSEYIRLRQKNGTLTVYDPRLYKESSDTKFKLNKKNFSSDIDINYDLIVGYMPCEATCEIIDSACSNKKDFMIALCDGNHQIFDDYHDSEEWFHKTIDYALSKLDGEELYISDLKRYNNPYPVIYTKRKSK